MTTINYKALNDARKRSVIAPEKLAAREVVVEEVVVVKAPKGKKKKSVKK